MGDIVEVRDETVPVVCAGETPRLRDLWAEMPENQDSRRIWPQQNGPDKKLKLVHRRIGAVMIVSKPVIGRSRTPELTLHHQQAQ